MPVATNLPKKSMEKNKDESSNDSLKHTGRPHIGLGEDSWAISQPTRRRLGL